MWRDRTFSATRLAKSATWDGRAVRERARVFAGGAAGIETACRGWSQGWTANGRRQVQSVTKTAMTRMCNRRQMLKLTGRLVVAGAVGPNIPFAAEAQAPGSQGLVAGQLSGA